MGESMNGIRHSLGRIRIAFLYSFWNCINKMFAYGNNVSFGSDLRTVGRIRIRNRGHIAIGNNVKINSSIMSDPLGGNTCSILVTTEGAKIDIGNNSGLSNTVIFARKEVIIGDNVNIGAGVCIYDNDFHQLLLSSRLACEKPTTKEIYIKDGAFIGAHSIILKGVTIGEQSVIGAGSIVTKSVPPHEIWAGNPARFIRVLEESKK